MFSKDYSKKSPMDKPFSVKCQATGCPMRGTLSAGGDKFSCDPHFFGDPNKWPQITESLIDNINIRLAIDEVLKIDECNWGLGQWQMMDKFFSGETHLKPSEVERNKKSWYEYRLRAWLAYLVGTTPRPPKVREKITMTKKMASTAW